LGPVTAINLDRVKDRADRHEDVADFRAAMVVPRGALKDDLVGERVVKPVLRIRSCEWK
jgi:hypothetical protein